MTFAQGSRHSIAFEDEVTFGVTPGVATTLLRNTGSDLDLTKEQLLSAEIRSDRQIEFSRHGNKQVGGNINAELAYGNMDSLLESVMFSTWSAFGGTAAGATTDAAGYAIGTTTINLAVAGTGTIIAGDVITFAGDSNPYVVVTGDPDVSDGGSVVIQAPGLKVAIPTSATAITVRAGSQLKAGVTQKSISFERRFVDISEYLVYAGCVANTCNVNVAAGQLLTSTVGFVGSSLTPSGSEIAVPSAAPSAEPFTAFEGALYEGGTLIANVTAMQMTMNNGVEANFVVGSDTTPQLSYGRSNLTGTLTAFFENLTLMNKFINETPSDLKMTLVDPAFNLLDFKIPNVKYNGGGVPVNTEQSLQINMPWQALYDTTEVSNLVITRNPAP